MLQMILLHTKSFRTLTVFICNCIKLLSSVFMYALKHFLNNSNCVFRHHIKERNMHESKHIHCIVLKRLKLNMLNNF